MTSANTYESSREAGKEIPEPSRLKFLEEFLASNFASSDTEHNTSGLLNRGGVYLCWVHYSNSQKVPKAKIFESDATFLFH